MITHTPRLGYTVLVENTSRLGRSFIRSVIYQLHVVFLNALATHLVKAHKLHAPPHTQTYAPSTAAGGECKKHCG
jgi:hypothetical protein